MLLTSTISTRTIMPLDLPTTNFSRWQKFMGASPQNNIRPTKHPPTLFLIFEEKTTSHRFIQIYISLITLLSKKKISLEARGWSANIHIIE